MKLYCNLKRWLSFVVMFVGVEPVVMAQRLNSNLVPQVEKMIVNLEDHELLGDEFVFFQLKDEVNRFKKHGENILGLTDFTMKKEGSIPGICTCMLTGDSIVIQGGIGYDDWVMVDFTYSKGTISGNFGIIDGMGSVAVEKPSTSKGKEEIYVATRDNSIVFASQPKMEMGEVIYMELNGLSKPFYELIDGQWVERRINIKAKGKCKLNEHGFL